ncbi:hypothetical protein UFOVP1670_3 [uncultured Caudovirales phage]|uniref:Lipoprotein n=1 Tax=uncultured Caudovirales phage TaxID=2100421 RepID=A0A6J5T8P8_9CAUD|nr:hypothetical protein UFOVP1670_3 [uncultured Caudovirales phage]
MKTIALLLFIILGGCAGPWHQPGRNQQDFAEDRYACDKDTAPVADQTRASVMWEACMKLKGWRR